MTDWKWWYSQDKESWQGPLESRDEAIKEGRVYYPDEGFYVCEAYMEDYHQLTVDPDEVLEQVADRFIELGNTEGDALFNDVTPTQNIDLGRMLTKTLHEWIETYDIKTGIYCFAETRNEEMIEPPETT